jgi:hypothetical protein
VEIPGADDSRHLNQPILEPWPYDEKNRPLSFATSRWPYDETSYMEEEKKMDDRGAMEIYEKQTMASSVATLTEADVGRRKEVESCETDARDKILVVLSSWETEGEKQADNREEIKFQQEQTVAIVEDAKRDIQRIDFDQETVEVLQTIDGKTQVVRRLFEKKQTAADSTSIKEEKSVAQEDMASFYEYLFCCNYT